MDGVYFITWEGTSQEEAPALSLRTEAEEDVKKSGMARNEPTTDLVPFVGRTVLPSASAAGAFCWHTGRRQDRPPHAAPSNRNIGRIRLKKQPPLHSVTPLQARETKPSAWVAVWQSVTSFQADKVTPWMALRNAVGIAIPLAVGTASGAISSGVTMSMGALNVAFSDSSEPYAQRGERMVRASIVVAIAVFAGALSGRDTVTSVAVATVWAFGAGMRVSLGQAAADIGALSLVVLVVFAAQSMPPEKAALAGLLALAGGLLQTLLAVLLWPVRRYDPERRALADLYRELARAAASRVSATDAPPASAESIEAQAAIATVGQNHSVEAERYRMLLSQAERIRLSLLALARLRIRIRREKEDSPAGEVLDRYLAISSSLLGSIGNSLLAGESLKPDPEHRLELQNLAERLREPAQDGSPALLAMALDARIQMDALGGQLRSALDLAAHAIPEGAVAFQQSEARQPWRLRIAGSMATLRANLTLKSAACRHAVRLAACIAVGDGLALGLHWPRPYWVPMTIAIVLKPDFSATFSRGVLRLAGTFIGLGFATALFHLMSPGIGMQVALITVMAFIMRSLGPANYGILVTAVTAYVVLLFAILGIEPKGVMVARGINTVVGGAIALLAYWIWPTWERTQVSESTARMLDAYRNYFRTIRESYLRPDGSLASELDRTRAAGRLARTNLEASIDRSTAEPGSSAESVYLLGALLASSRRLTHAMMALEAGLARSHPGPVRPAFRTLADHIELTLYYLAAALRGSPLKRSDLPDLREDHHALVASGDSLSERYALVNVETDRITNSLNTLSEEVLRWIDLQSNFAKQSHSHNRTPAKKEN